MNTTDPDRPGLDAHAQRQTPAARIGTVSTQATATSATMCPIRMARRRTGVSSSRSKYPFWMSSTSDPARDTPVTPIRMAVGSMNALMSKPLDVALGQVLQRPDVDHEEEQGDEDGRDHRRQLAGHRPQRPPGDRGDVAHRMRRPMGDDRARPPGHLSGVADRGHRPPPPARDRSQIVIARFVARPSWM